MFTVRPHNHTWNIFPKETNFHCMECNRHVKRKTKLPTNTCTCSKETHAKNVDKAKVSTINTHMHRNIYTCIHVYMHVYYTCTCTGMVGNISHNYNPPLIIIT